MTEYQKIRPLVKAILAIGMIGGLFALLFSGVEVQDALWALAGAVVTHYFQRDPDDDYQRPT